MLGFANDAQPNLHKNPCLYPLHPWSDLSRIHRLVGEVIKSPTETVGDLVPHDQRNPTYFLLFNHYSQNSILHPQ